MTFSLIEFGRPRPSGLVVASLCLLVVVVAQLGACAPTTEAAAGQQVLSRAELVPGHDYVTLRLRNMGRMMMPRANKDAKSPLDESEEVPEDKEKYVELEPVDATQIQLMITWMEGIRNQLDVAYYHKLALKDPNSAREHQVDVETYKRFLTWWREFTKAFIDPSSELGQAVLRFLNDEQNRELAKRAHRIIEDNRQLELVAPKLMEILDGKRRPEQYEELDKLLKEVEHLLATTDPSLKSHELAQKLLDFYKKKHHGLDTIDKFVNDELTW